jgi:flagellar hook-length control protein FliK
MAQTVDVQSGVPPAQAGAVPLVDSAMPGTAGQMATPAAAHKPDPSLAAGAAEDSSHIPAANELPASPAGPVQMSQMVSQAAQAEMRIGMNTLAFGSVEVRTTVHANDVGVLIGSEKGDLRSLLAPELPGIANTLQQQNLRLSQVSFQQGFAFSSNLSSGGDSQQRSFAGAYANRFSPQSADESGEEIPSALETVRNSSAGLSILA